MVVQLRSLICTSMPEADDVRNIEKRIAEETGYTPEGTPFRSQLNLEIDRNKLLIYNVDYNDVGKSVADSLERQSGLYAPFVSAVSSHWYSRTGNECEPHSGRNYGRNFR